jgi:endonuclease YncB( thermonuclease family)
MPLRRPRRIFRAAPARPRTPTRSPAWILLAGAAALGSAGGAVALGNRTILPHPHPLQATDMAAATVRAEAAGVAVIDGETLRLDDTVVRLRGVTAPARGTACRRGDGVAYDCGAGATEALARLVRDRPVICRLQGRDPDGLPRGACQAGGTDIAGAMVRAGAAGGAPED